MTPSIDAIMQWDWVPTITKDADEESVLALRVLPLADFVIYGEDELQLRNEWRDALRAHLLGYLSVDKIIPRPIRVSVSMEQLELTSQGPSGWSRAQFILWNSCRRSEREPAY